MSSQSGRKINRLLKGWPPGTVVTKTQLDRLGIYRQLMAKYVHSNWVERLGSGAYTRSGDTVNWQGGLYALQSQLDVTVHIGARTALELQGRSHFIPLGENKKVVLISDLPEHLPAWFKNHKWKIHLEHHCLTLFKNVEENTTTKLDCGGFEVVMSSAERAIMEQMRLVRNNDDIIYVYQLMEGLTTLRPSVIQELLENCCSVKVKRLFLWNAEVAEHVWFKRMDISRVDLGQGKRRIYKGGQLNEKYGITVPRPEGLRNV